MKLRIPEVRSAKDRTVITLNGREFSRAEFDLLVQRGSKESRENHARRLAAWLSIGFAVEEKTPR